MNVSLNEKVRAKCKDMGLSEKYLNAITEAIGGSIADDSTDETAIENVANQIAAAAAASQAEATRWVNARKPQEHNVPTQQPTTTPKPLETEKPEWFKQYEQEQLNKIKALEEKNREITARYNSDKRSEAISSAFDKHNIPANLRQFISVPDDVENIEQHIANAAQVLTTMSLPTGVAGQQDPNAKTSNDSIIDALKTINNKTE